MEPTAVNLHTAFRVGSVDPRIFGGFLEHLGRAVYGGVYDPGSPLADEDGFRTDVIEALRRLRMTVMRYPGGNFASGYHWLDGVGPRESRPRVRELAWHSMEPNLFGTDEFVRLCRKAGWQPMITVNLGTGSPEEARNWVEYCNSPAGTRYADMRAGNGRVRPHAVKLWCLGNEMDGDWQLGHVPAEQYATRATQAAKMMKEVDPGIELVACGSSAPSMPTYLEWDRVVLGQMREMADYVSLHRYVGNPKDDTLDFLAVSNSIEEQIVQVDAVCRCVQGRHRSRKRPYLCFDEWNVWYRNTRTDGGWTVAPPLLEEVYNLEDALVVAGFLHCFIRHADCVKVANLAQIVNVIAPLITRPDGLLVQPIFYPFLMFSSRRGGLSLRVGVEGPAYESPSYGRATFIEASATLERERLHVFLTNRSPEDKAPVRILVADRGLRSVESAELLTGPDAKAANTFEQPDVVRAVPFEEVRITTGCAETVLPPLSLVAVTLALS